eukprot:32714-Hanusia_phi.AAC.1
MKGRMGKRMRPQGPLKILTSPIVSCSMTILLVWLSVSFYFIRYRAPQHQEQDSFPARDHTPPHPRKSVLDVRPPIRVNEMKKAAEALLVRVLGSHAAKAFQIEIIVKASSDDPDSFEVHDLLTVEGGSARILLRGTDAVAVASALNWYLRYHCNVDTSWMSKFPLKLPRQLPQMGRSVVKQSLVKWGYYENVCTFSYTQAWWDWERWEREIDWMAMNGINLPLSLTGQEYISQRVFRKLGLTPEQVSSYFTGPAFLAWNRMINIKGWGGPLTQSWMDQQKDLQLKILARERELGMVPVLPAFAGGVPEGMKSLFPEAKFTRHGNWGGFSEEHCCVMMVDPTDPLFLKIGKMFVEEVRAVYGSNHIYSCDTFNENRPRSKHGSVGLDFLSHSSRAVFESMRAADPDAVWLMQGWLFMNDARFWQKQELDAYLSGVPEDRMIILDLFTDVFPVWKRRDLQRPTPIEKRRWIWNMLHSFGGISGMYGRLQVISKDPIAAKKQSNTMVGVGITTEGIEQNPVVYEMMAEMRWREQEVDIMSWVEQWADRRLGPQASKERRALGEEAWKELAATVYSCPGTQMGQVKSMVESRPRLDLATGWIPHSDFMPIKRHYPDTALVRAWLKLLRATRGGEDGYTCPSSASFDMADVTRQVLSDLFARLFQPLASFCETRFRGSAGALQSPQGGIRTEEEAEKRMQTLLEIISDMDQIVGTQPRMLLGKWIEEARAWGKTKEEEEALEFNARNLVTLWGPRGEIADYASKQWQGLLSDYYMRRWKLFFEHLQQAIKGTRVFSQERFQQELLVFEQQWQTDTSSSFPSSPAGDAVELAWKLHDKYAHLIQETLGEEAGEPLSQGPVVHAPGADILADDAPRGGEREGGGVENEERRGMEEPKGRRQI